MSFKIHSQRRRTKVFNSNIYFQVSCFSVLGMGFHELPEYFGPLHVLGSSEWVVVAVACCTAHNLYTTCENKNMFYVPKRVITTNAPVNLTGQLNLQVHWYIVLCA